MCCCIKLYGKVKGSVNGLSFVFNYLADCDFYAAKSGQDHIEECARSFDVISKLFSAS